MSMRMTGLILLLTAGAATAPLAADSIRVVATVPNLGALAEEVGGDRVKVTTIALGLQDAHFVDPKPSFIVTLRSADLLLINGLDLEIGWVPPLTQGARNTKVLHGGAGYIDCSRAIAVMEIPSGPVSRAQGDVHPYGNPHYLTDPLNAEIVAGEIAQALKTVSPADSGFFDKRLSDFTLRLHRAVFGPELVDLIGGARLVRLARTGQLIPYLEETDLDGRSLVERLSGWMGRLRPFAGTKIVTYHRDYSYFANRFNLDIVDYVEPKPGIPPSAKHLADLNERLGRGDVKLIITRPYVEHRSTDRLGESSSIPVLVLPIETGAEEGMTDYFDIFDRVTFEIAKALGGS